MTQIWKCLDCNLRNYTSSFRCKACFSEKNNLETNVSPDAVTVMLQESMKKKQYHNENYISVDMINTKEYIKKRQEETKLTNKILSKKCSGNPSDKDTLLHVLAGFSKSQGKECIFTDSSDNKNSKFISNMGVKNQNCVLELDNLNDVVKAPIQKNEAKVLKQEIVQIQTDLKNHKKNNIVENLKIKLGKAHGVDPKHIRINDVYYGSAHIDYDIITSFNKQGVVSQALKDQFRQYKDLKLHPLFFDHSFNINDFDERGNKNFGSGSTFDVGPPGHTQKYIQPTGWTRYGLNVLDGRYPGDNKWLDPFQDPGNWYRAYHGTSLACSKLIVSDKSHNDGNPYFEPGDGQACRGDTNTNTLSGGGTCGRGVYVSPTPDTAFIYSQKHDSVAVETAQGTKRYHMMFQVCVDPTVVKFSHSVKDYWIVPSNCPQGIRPYGMLLKEVKF